MRSGSCCPSPLSRYFNSSPANLGVKILSPCVFVSTFHRALRASKALHSTGVKAFGWFLSMVIL